MVCVDWFPEGDGRLVHSEFSDHGSRGSVCIIEEGSIEHAVIECIGLGLVSLFVRRLLNLPVLLHCLFNLVGYNLPLLFIVLVPDLYDSFVHSLLHEGGESSTL